MICSSDFQKFVIVANRRGVKLTFGWFSWYLMSVSGAWTEVCLVESGRPDRSDQLLMGAAASG